MPAPTADPQLTTQLIELLGQALKPLARSALFFVDRVSPLYWPYLLTTLLFGLFGWWRFERRGRGGLQDFKARHFSKAQWWHPSARVDYRYYVMNTVLFTLAIAPVLISSAWLAGQAESALRLLFGSSPAWQAGIATRVLYTLLFFVAFDLGRWLAHTLLHDVPLLWEFHKVHHSAEVLTPFTAFRVHPLDLLITLTVPTLTTATVIGVFTYLYPGVLNAYSFLGLNFIIGLSGLIANLKHWQVWFTYGPLDGWWISPAHHQIHHSAEPQHWGKNRGFELGIWDRWYGTLHVPARESEITALGLGDGTDGQWHTLRSLYLRPFCAAFRMLASRPAKATTTGALVFTLMVLLPATPAQAADSVYLDDLTWPELAAAINAGSTTVLVPIGGTEQNGPAMAFSKHNDIVRAAAGEIANRAGHALVAPVMPFAPEGSFAPRSGNQQWPGTIGLREETLTAVLEDEVTSLALAGFRNIVFLGDHGGSQKAQADVAKRLSSALASRGIAVYSLDRYYEPASLSDRVKRLGIDPALSGDHAGLVDTSELLSVAPAQVRKDRLDPKTWAALAAAPGPGSSGHPEQATAELGRALLEQRIAAAVMQLKVWIEPRPPAKP